MDVDERASSDDSIVPSSLLAHDAHSGDPSNPFAMVAQNLSDLGAIPVNFLADSSQTLLRDFGISYSSNIPSRNFSFTAPLSTSSLSSASVPIGLDSQGRTIPSSSSPDMRQVAELYDICSQAFGIYEALQFEFLEDHGPNRKQCILTITRPDGISRSYTTQPEFERKSEAKARVAAIAIDMDAVDFVLHGDQESTNSQSVPLAPLDGHLELPPERKEKPKRLSDQQDTCIAKIENDCIEWRAARVKPKWVDFSKPKADLYGCALAVELSTHSKRVYSVDAIFASVADAKVACAGVAVKSGVIEFIRHGNGQKTPAVQTDDNAIPVSSASSPKGPISLQAFYDSLPKPFPENVGDKSANDINAPGRLNSLVQQAKGTKLMIQHYFITHPKSGLHGCLLRAQKGSDLRSYLVDALFQKRADARAAACLQAMSEGIGKYVRQLANEIENRITPAMREDINGRFARELTSACVTFNEGRLPDYSYTADLGAFGCTLTIFLSKDRKDPIEKSWNVPTEFRTKNDAKVAVMFEASKNGIIEFLKNSGGSLSKPADHGKKRKRTAGSESEDGQIKREPSGKGSLNSRPLPPNPRLSTGSSVKPGVPSKDMPQHNAKPKHTRYLPKPTSSKPRQTIDPHLSDVSALATAVIEQIEEAAAATPSRTPGPRPLPLTRQSLPQITTSVSSTLQRHPHEHAPFREPMHTEYRDLRYAYHHDYDLPSRDYPPAIPIARVDPFNSLPRPSQAHPHDHPSYHDHRPLHDLPYDNIYHDEPRSYYHQPITPYDGPRSRAPYREPLHSTRSVPSGWRSPPYEYSLARPEIKYDPEVGKYYYEEPIPPTSVQMSRSQYAPNDSDLYAKRYPLEQDLPMHASKRTRTSEPDSWNSREYSRSGYM